MTDAIIILYGYKKDGKNRGKTVEKRCLFDKAHLKREREKEPPKLLLCPYRPQKEMINPKFPFGGQGALDLCQVHLLYQMRGAGKFVDKEQHIANVDHDVAAN